MFEFFSYVNSPLTSVDDIVIPSWLDDWRYSQLDSYERNYEKGGWNFNSWNEHQRVMKYSLSNEANSALTLQLPGVLLYTRDVMLPLFQDYVAGEKDMTTVKQETVEGWNDVTDGTKLFSISFCFFANDVAPTLFLFSFVIESLRQNEST